MGRNALIPLSITRRGGSPIRLRLLAALLVLLPVAAPLAAHADPASPDPLRSKQWGLDRIQAEAAWPMSTGAGVVIAILDTGVDLTHPDLSSNLLGPGADFVTANCDPAGKKCSPAQDRNGHGTHVAGIAAASTNNGIGISGVAPAAGILPVRVLDSNGRGQTQRIAAGIDYAVVAGAQVINLSLSFVSLEGEVARIRGNMRPLYEAVDRAFEAGAVVVVAAGNDSVPLCAEPAAHPRVVCVGATNSNDMRAWYSNGDATGQRYYVSAPGGEGALSCSADIFSTFLQGAETSCSGGNPGYEATSGTSMAAPHVSGVAALLMAKGLDNRAAITCITTTATDLGAPGRDPVFGYGRINARRAVTNC